MKRFLWPLAVLGSLMLTVGCTKQVPAPDLNFETTQKVVLTFRTGEEVEGKISPGSKVQLREPGVIWRARVGDVTEDKIILKGLTQVRTTSSMEAQAARLADAKVAVTESAPDKTLLRSDITGMQLIRFDAGRTAQRTSFWAYGAAALVLLLGERS